MSCYFFKNISIMLFRGNSVWAGLISTLFGKTFGLRMDTMGNSQGWGGGYLAHLLSIRTVWLISPMLSQQK